MESKWISKELTLVSVNEYNCPGSMSKKSNKDLLEESRERENENEKERKTKPLLSPPVLLLLLLLRQSAFPSSASAAKERDRVKKVKKEGQFSTVSSLPNFISLLFRVSKWVNAFFPLSEKAKPCAFCVSRCIHADNNTCSGITFPYF